MHLEGLLLLGIYQRAGHIGRKQVRGELDTVELGVHSLGEGADGKGLGKARDSLEQDVAVCKQGDEQILYQVLLPHDHLAHLQGEHVHEPALHQCVLHR